MVHVDPITGETTVKTFQVDPETDKPLASHLATLPYTLVAASPSHDAFALGMVLFQLCSGKTFFHADCNDNIDSDQLKDLAEFSREFVVKKLRCIPDTIARNLVSQLLNKDPTKRPSMAHCMVHPFVTGKAAARMAGEAAEFDVFLSYRVASDAMHVEKVYDVLRAMGLRVWWDKRELLPGERWEGDPSLCWRLRPLPIALIVFLLLGCYLY